MITQKGNNVLRIKARDVLPAETGSEKIKNVLEKMAKELAKSEYGVAIAAPQVGESLRIFMIDESTINRSHSEVQTPSRNSDSKLTPRKNIVFINPVIKKLSKKKQVVEEGCLSVPKTYGNVERAEKLTIEARDEDGKKFTHNASGLLAQIIQHEIDHLDGILFIDKAKGLREVEN